MRLGRGAVGAGERGQDALVRVELQLDLLGVEPQRRPGGHGEAVAHRPGVLAEEGGAADVGDAQVELPALLAQPVVAGPPRRRGPSRRAVRAA